MELGGQHVEARRAYTAMGAVRDARRLAGSLRTHRAVTQHLTKRQGEIVQLLLLGYGLKPRSPKPSRTAEHHLTTAMQSVGAKRRSDLRTNPHIAHLLPLHSRSRVSGKIHRRTLVLRLLGCNQLTESLMRLTVQSEDRVVVLAIDGPRWDLESLRLLLQGLGQPAVVRPPLSITQALLGLADHPDRHVLLIFNPETPSSRRIVKKIVTGALAIFCLSELTMLPTDAQIAPGVTQSAAKIATINGTVEASDGKPSANATVQIIGPTVAGTTSDSRGAFVFKNVQFGKYLIVVNTPGLGQAVRPNFTIAGDLSMSIRYSQTNASSSLKTIAEVSTSSPGAHINMTSSAVTSELAKYAFRAMPHGGSSSHRFPASPYRATCREGTILAPF